MENVFMRGEEMIAISKFLYNIKFRNSGVDRDDLIQEGCISILKAQATYQPEKGKFSTYAYKCASVGMLTFCKRELKHKNNLSLDAARLNENLDLYIEDPPTNELLISQTQSAIRALCKDYSPQKKDIIKRFIDGERQLDIAEDYNQSRQCINKKTIVFKNKFRDTYVYGTDGLFRK